METLLGVAFLVEELSLAASVASVALNTVLETSCLRLRGTLQSVLLISVMVLMRFPFPPLLLKQSKEMYTLLFSRQLIEINYTKCE